MREVAIDIEGMHCAACGLLIDDVMLDIDGVRSSVTDTRSGLCKVEAADHIPDADLLAAVVEAGYTGVIRSS